MNLFPTITKFDLTHGRTRMAGRKQRIKKYMENTNQWIPLTGPGGRLPTIEDGDSTGLVYVTFDGKYDVRPWGSIPRFATHFFPIQKVPPLPKPVEKTQEDLDEAYAKVLWARNGSMPWKDTVDGIRYGRSDGRSDGRAQLAREALGLFDNCCPMIEVAQELDDIKLPNTAKTVRKLHELLTKALEASVLQASAAREKP